MKKPYTFFVVFLLTFFCGVLSPLSGQWLKHDISLGDPNPIPSMDVGDLDGDDTLDVVVSHNVTNEVVWYKNKNGGKIWEEDTIDANLTGAWLVWIADIDGDGDLDVVATGQKANDVVWYENNGGAPISWTRNPIDANLYDARDVAAADIDGNDTLDVIASSWADDDVVWYENNHPNWNKYDIEDNLDGANYIYPADLDSDGDPDLIVGGWRADRIVWYENNLPNWIRHDIDSKIDGPVIFEAADLDGDGDLDVVATGESEHDVVWYENDQLTWHKKIIDDNLGNALGVTTGDIDGDSRLDVIAAGFSAHKVVWYKNNLPADTWTSQTIGLMNYAEYVKVGDIDKDNDLDVILATFGYYNGQDDGDVYWYENALVDGYEKNVKFTPFIFSLSQNHPNPFNPSTTIVFDLPKSSNVTIEVYNVAGQKIQTLLNKKMQAGNHQVEFYAKDLSSGLYFYRIEAGEFQDVKKMILLR